jgi:F0F1-type ATP synthase membrane subunit b/b'
METLDSILSVFTLIRIDLVMIIVCMGLFYVLWRNLDRLFISKYLRYLEHRQKITEGNLEQAAIFQKAVIRLNTELNEQRKAVRLRSLQKRTEKISDMKKEIEAVLKECQARINTKLEQNRNECEKTLTNIDTAIRKSLPDLVAEVKAALLGSSLMDRSTLDNVQRKLKNKKNVPLILFVMSFLLYGNSVALASSDSAEHHSSFFSILYPTINFAIFAFVLFQLAKKPLAEVWKKRRESLANKLADVTVNYEKAKLALEKAEAERASLHDELIQIENQFEQQTMIEINELRKLMKTKVSQMESELSLKLQRQEKAMKDEFMEKIVDQIISQVRSDLTSDFSNSQKGIEANRDFTQKRLTEIKKRKELETVGS